MNLNRFLRRHLEENLVLISAFFNNLIAIYLKKLKEIDNYGIIIVEKLKNFKMS